MKTIPAHKPVEFTALNGDISPQKFSVAAFGEGGTGKTRLGVTAPTPGFIPLNRKCRPTVEQIWRSDYPDKQIYFPTIDLIRHANPMALAMMEPFCENKLLKLTTEAPKCCARHYYRWHVNRVKDAIWTLADESHPCRTIVIDDGTQLYEDILYAHYGRAYRISEDKTVYGPPNQEMIDLINSIDHKHLIIIHQAKDEYRGKNATGRDTVKGFREVGYYVNILVEMSRDLEKQDFFMSTRMCQDNASLHGDKGSRMLKNEDITFVSLAQKIYGDEIDILEYL